MNTTPQKLSAFECRALAWWQSRRFLAALGKRILRSLRPIPIAPISAHLRRDIGLTEKAERPNSIRPFF